VYLLQFGLRVGSANSVHRQFIVALEFFDGGFEGVRVGVIELASEVPEIVEAGDLAGEFIDGIEMANSDGNDVVGEGRLIAADGEVSFRSIQGDVLLELAAAVGG